MGRGDKYATRNLSVASALGLPRWAGPTRACLPDRGSPPHERDHAERPPPRLSLPTLESLHRLHVLKVREDGGVVKDVLHSVRREESSVVLLRLFPSRFEEPAPVRRCEPDAIYKREVRERTNRPSRLH